MHFNNQLQIYGLKKSSFYEEISIHEKILQIEEISDKILILLESGVIEVVEKTELIAKKWRRNIIADEEIPIESTVRENKVEEIETFPIETPN